MKKRWLIWKLNMSLSSSRPMKATRPRKRNTKTPELRSMNSSNSSIKGRPTRSPLWTKTGPDFWIPSPRSRSRWKTNSLNSTIRSLSWKRKEAKSLRRWPISRKKISSGSPKNMNSCRPSAYRKSETSMRPSSVNTTTMPLSSLPENA